MWVELQINIFMCFLLILTLIHGCYKLNTGKETYKYFLITKSLIIFIMCLECVSVILNGCSFSSYIVIVNKITNVLGFLLTPVIPFLYWLFLTSWLDIRGNFKIIESIFAILVILNGVLSILSYKFNLIFTVLDNGVYERGPLFFSNGCICILIISGCCYIILKEFKFLSTEERWVFSLNLLVPCLLSSIQISKFKVLTIWSSCGIICILTYIFLLNDKSKKDPLTGLLNRQVYYDEINKISKGKYKKLSIINIDIDKFKSINDKYGHAEGDFALIGLSSILLRIFRGCGEVIRIGGDEFLIFLYEDSPSKIQRLMDILLEELDIYNKNMDKEYCIQISYGVKVFNYDDINIKDALVECDRLMYKNKLKK
ncbi:MAG: diguanylate cyclase [Clostridium sp.]